MKLKEKAKRADELARNMMGGGTIFNNLGMYYIGPIDGYNILDLVKILKNLKNSVNDVQFCCML